MQIPCLYPKNSVTMKKHILHIPYSKRNVCNGAHGIHCVRNTFRARNTSHIHSLFIWCGIGLLWLCTACTEQDEFSAATLQPLTFIIDEPLPFQEMTAGSGNTAAQPSGRDDSHARPHTRIADSGKAVSWENNDKIYLAAAITVSTSTTYAYSTATYNGSTKKWSALTPPISAPAGANVNVEAIYAKGTLSGNTMTLADNSIIMKASTKNIKVTAPAEPINLTFLSTQVRVEVAGMDNGITPTSSLANIPQSIDIQPAKGSFSITTASKTDFISDNGVYYVFPGGINLATSNHKVIALTNTRVNSSYFLDMSGRGGHVRPDGDIHVGDYYYSDGTWSDGGYRLLTDGTFLQENVPPLAGKTCIGIVFAVGHSDYDTSNYRNTGIRQDKCQAYVIALKDAGAECRWGVPGPVVGCSVSNNGSYPEKDWSGYSYTKKIDDYATKNGSGLDPENFDGYPATYYAKIAYETQVAAPATSSGWFLPAIGQLYEIWQQKDLLHNIIPDHRRYWSSSEDSANTSLSVLVLDVAATPVSQRISSLNKHDRYSDPNGTYSWAILAF